MIEAIVESMHESDGVKVERNVKLPPIGSQGPKREIDVLVNIAKKWTMPIRDWKPALNRLAVEFAERFPK